MGAVFTRRPDELDCRVEPFLAERPHRNVAASLLAQARAGALADAELVRAKIYAAVGFRRFGEWEELEFDPAPPWSVSVGAGGGRCL